MLSGAVLLLVVSWQASADTCGPNTTALRCGPIIAAATFSEPAQNGLPQGANPRQQPWSESPAAQSASLLLLGAGFAMAAQSLKRAKQPS